VLGAVSGLFLGFFLDGFLLFRSALLVGSITVIILPAAGLIVGAAWGYLAPFGKRG
jgi:hypothetical protein